MTVLRCQQMRLAPPCAYQAAISPRALPGIAPLHACWASLLALQAALLSASHQTSPAAPFARRTPPPAQQVYILLPRRPSNGGL